MKKYFGALLVGLVLSQSIFSGRILAAENEYELVIKAHQFSPKTLQVPAGKKIKLIVRNEDATAEEFESYDLNREKVVAGNSKITVFIGPLAAKTYKF